MKRIGTVMLIFTMSVFISACGMHSNDDDFDQQQTINDTPQPE
ncbi:hypothetical protein ACFOU0_13160 [Salinicoccus sesuvii]|uniref:Lipoprotein n=1 Tax=Salinicoccus sesuvii TaxID=868281 RepID=A0ABV7NAM5_9STAP